MAVRITVSGEWGCSAREWTIRSRRPPFSGQRIRKRSTQRGLMLVASRICTWSIPSPCRGRRSRSTSTPCPAKKLFAGWSYLFASAPGHKKLIHIQPKWKDESLQQHPLGQDADDLRFVRRDRPAPPPRVLHGQRPHRRVQVPDGRRVRERQRQRAAGPLPRRDRRDDLVVGADRLGPLLPLRPRRQAQECRSPPAPSAPAASSPSTPRTGCCTSTATAASRARTSTTSTSTACTSTAPA